MSHEQRISFTSKRYDSVKISHLHCIPLSFNSLNFAGWQAGVQIFLS